MLTTRELRDRVEVGIAWLDVHVPDWPDRIDLDQLDIESRCNCVLGQLIGDFYDTPISVEQAVACGFDAEAGDGIAEEYAALTELWKTAVRERRALAEP